MEESINDIPGSNATTDRLREKQNHTAALKEQLSPLDRYLLAFGCYNYHQNDSPRKISLDPKSRGFTVDLIECYDLQETYRFNIPSLVKYLDNHTGQVSFYLYGLSDDKEGKLTLLNSISKLNEIDFKNNQCLFVSFKENSEVYQEIIKKKAHTPISNQYLVAGLLLTLIKTKYDALNALIRDQNDPTALFIAISQALKKPENYDIDWLSKAVTISNIEVAIRFAISRRDLLLFNFLEKSGAPIELDADQQQKVNWLRQINKLQQKVRKSFLPELLARFIWYKKESQQLRHEQKNLIKAKGALADLVNQIHHSPVAAILKGTYYESNDIEKRQALAQKIADKLTAYSHYQKTPLMTPLIHLLALNMLMGPGGPILTSKQRNYRPLKIMITTDTEIRGLSPHILSEGHKAATGEYPINGNNLFVSFDESRNIEEVSRTLIHEAAHLAANEVYQHGAQPYRKRDVSTKKRYQSTEQIIRSQINHWVPQSQEEWLLIESFRNVFLYKDKDIIAELFVRVPEAIVILGYEQGLVWLNQRVPELLKLYEEEFLPDCLQYLKYRQINAHFSSDPFFADTLQATGLAELSLVLNKREIKMFLLSFVALTCGIILAAINPATFILGMILIALAFIEPLTIAIKFHQVTANRLVAIEVEDVLPNHPEIIVPQCGLVYSAQPSLLSKSNFQQTDNLLSIPCAGLN